MADARNKRMKVHRATKVRPAAIIAAGRQVIALEAQALTGLARRLDESFVNAVQWLAATEGRLVFSGIGKSGVIARKTAGMFAAVCMPAFFMHPVEALHGDLGMVTRSDCGVLISASGETPELLRLRPWLERVEIPVIALTGRTDHAASVW